MRVKKVQALPGEIEAGRRIGRKRVKEPDCGPLATAANVIVAPWVALSDKGLDIAAPAEENKQNAQKWLSKNLHLHE